MDGKSILSYTLSLPLGEQRKIYIGGSVTDLPGDYCKYSEAVVCKLNNTFAQIVIHPRNSGPIECTNTFNGSVWDGWRFGLSNADMIYSNSLTDLVSQMAKLQTLRAYTLFADSQLGFELTGALASCTGVISKLSSTMYDMIISQSGGIYIYTIRIQNGVISSRRRITLTQVE